MELGQIKPTPQLLGLSKAEAEIIQLESSFNNKAKNKNSTAYGLWQGLESTRHKYGKLVGVEPNTDNPYKQIKMFRKYIADRYGTAEKALEFHHIAGFY